MPRSNLAQCGAETTEVEGNFRMDKTPIIAGEFDAKNSAQMVSPKILAQDERTMREEKEKLEKQRKRSAEDEKRAADAFQKSFDEILTASGKDGSDKDDEP